MLKQTFQELQNWKPDMNLDFGYAMFLPDKTYLIIINPVSKLPEDILAEVTL